jgi:hypothetical protein
MTSTSHWGIQSPEEMTSASLLPQGDAQIASLSSQEPSQDAAQGEDQSICDKIANDWLQEAQDSHVPARNIVASIIAKEPMLYAYIPAIVKAGYDAGVKQERKAQTESWWKMAEDNKAKEPVTCYELAHRIWSEWEERKLKPTEFLWMAEAALDVIDAHFPNILPKE